MHVKALNRRIKLMFRFRPARIRESYNQIYRGFRFNLLGAVMFGSPVIAPFAICAVVAAAAPPLTPVNPPMFPAAATLTSTLQLTSVDRNQSPPASAAAVPGGSLPFGLPQVLAIMTALAAFNPDSAATMQSISTALLDELAQGKPLGEAMVDVSVQLFPSAGGDQSSPIDTVLNQIGPMLALVPTVIAGGMTVLAAIPQAVIPVVAAVVVGVINSAAAVGSDGFAATVQTGLTDVFTAVGKALATMVQVVQNVLHDIAAVVTGGSSSSTPAPAAAEALSAPAGARASGHTTNPDSMTKRAASSATPARGVAGPRPRHSTSASVTASSNRSTGSARASGEGDAHPAGAKGSAKSAR